MKRTFAFVVCVVLLCAAGFFGVRYFAKEPDFSATDFLMDTAVTVTVTGKDGERIARECLNTVKEAEIYSLSRTATTSDVYFANQTGETRVNALTANALEQTLAICEKSEGALDIGLGALSDLWGIKTNTAPPAKEKITPLAGTQYNKITLEGSMLSVAAPAVLDLGAVGKGIACDAVRDLLQTQTVTRGVVAVGGSILLYGGGDFTVGIAHPERGSSATVATVKTAAGCVSTSGTYERYFDYNGVRYHHILDPQTGYPVQNELLSVTVFSQNGLTSDALSTACFVLGTEKGLALAKEYGCEALFINKEKQIVLTDGLRERVTLTDDTYTLL